MYSSLVRHHRSITGLRQLGLSLLLLLCLTPLHAKELAGKVQFVVGKVTAISIDGDLRQLKKGDRIFSGDTIKSGANGSAQFIFRDRSRMVLRVNTAVIIDEYRYDKDNESESKSLFSLLGGALRAITGLIGKANRDNVVINSPIATIGIRGTDHEVIHITPEFNGGQSGVEIGTYDKVYQGATILKSIDSTIRLNLNEVGFVGGKPGNIAKPIRLKELPKIIENRLVKKVPMQAAIRKKKTGKDSSGASRKTQPIIKTNPASVAKTLSNTSIDSKKAINNTINNDKATIPQPASRATEMLNSSTKKIAPAATRLLPNMKVIEPKLPETPVLKSKGLQPKLIIQPKIKTIK